MQCRMFAAYCAPLASLRGFRPPVDHAELDSPVVSKPFRSTCRIPTCLTTRQKRSMSWRSLSAPDADKFLPAFGLGDLNKGEQRRACRARGTVEGGGAFCVAADRAEVFFYILLKALFLYVEVGHNIFLFSCLQNSNVPTVNY